MFNIVIPVYKAKDTLPELLNCLTAQTYKMFIVTISQDGDGEDYSEIIQEYKKRGLHIGLIKSEVNGGPGIARQRGLDNSKNCDYIAFCDADDLVTPRFVEVLYKEAKRNKVDVLTSDFIAETKYSSHYMSVTKTPITWFHGKIYRTEYLKKNNIRFLEGLRLNEDSYFNLVAINCTQNKKKIQEYTYIWRHNKDSLTRKEDDKIFFERSWEQYVLSQVKGIQTIVSILNDINVNVLAATLLNIYNHCMTALFLKKSYSEVEELLKELKEVSQIQKYFEDKQFWGYIYQHLKGCNFLNGNLFFFKERFIDWFLKYVSKDGKKVKYKDEEKKEG